jgi:orotidine-5'-phosphate decarboxylase
MADQPSTHAPDRAPDEVRRRLALVLDVDDLVAATRLATTLRPWFGVAKVGLELYAAAGPDAVGAMRDLGYEVFVDLKMHDIPTTVGRAARVVGALGASYLTLHARDDLAMLRAGVDGLAEGAAAAGLPDPCALAVTVLTSDATAPPHILPRRIALAAEAGCGGTGIRAAGAPTHDQARTATPAEALAAGADLLVIGRTVTHAPDPAAAAAELVGSLPTP